MLVRVASCSSRSRVYDGASWDALALPPETSGLAAQQMLAVGSTLHVVLVDPTDPDRVGIARHDGTRWLPTLQAPGERRPATIVLGKKTSRNSRTLLVAAVSAKRREVFRLDNDQWTRVAWRPAAGLPNQNSGPLQTSRSILLSRTTLEGTKWPFLVDAAGADRRLKPASRKPLNPRGTAAQGQLLLVGTRPWAIWQEADTRASNDVITTIHAAELTSEGRIGRRTEVTRFRSFAPATLGLARIWGAVYALAPSTVGAPPRATRVELIRVK